MIRSGDPYIKNMIPTVTKQNLPNFLSYSIGAQALANALTRVPQLESLSLRFLRHHNAARKSEGKHICIAAQYTKYNIGLSASHYLDESKFYGPKWDATVYAVPPSHNSRIRNAIKDHGLAMLFAWLTERRTETWLATSHRLVLWFCADTESIVQSIENN